MNRNFGLDLLRACSIWLVLLQHGGINLPHLQPLKIGGIGVEIFFVLSGFLIGGILFRELDKGQSLPITLKSFWVRRWLRILPLYYAVLLFKFFVIDASIGKNIFYYVFFLQNNFYGIQYLSVSWSLVIEEWFYLFAPFFLFAIIRFLKTDRKIVFAMLGFILLINLLRVVYVYYRQVPYEGVNSSFVFRFDSLFLGVLLAFFQHRKLSIFQRLCSPVYLTAGALLFFGYIAWYWYMASVGQINQLFFPRTFGFFLLPFSIALTVPFFSTLTGNAQGHRFRQGIVRFLTWTSVLTYGIYLIHPFIFELQFPLLLKIALTYGAAWLVYRFFEQPILKFRDRITSSSSREAPAMEQKQTVLGK